jgi:hypothetical protein
MLYTCVGIIYILYICMCGDPLEEHVYICVYIYAIYVIYICVCIYVCMYIYICIYTPAIHTYIHI